MMTSISQAHASHANTKKIKRSSIEFNMDQNKPAHSSLAPPELPGGGIEMLIFGCAGGMRDEYEARISSKGSVARGSAAATSVYATLHPVMDALLL
jgi:hypothetical protein